MASAGEPRESKRRRNVRLAEEPPLDQWADHASLGTFGEVEIRRQVGRKREGVAAVPGVTEAVGDAGESRAPTVAFVEPDQAMSYVLDALSRRRLTRRSHAMMSPVDGTEGSSAAAAAIARSRKKGDVPVPRERDAWIPAGIWLFNSHFDACRGMRRQPDIVGRLLRAAVQGWRPLSKLSRWVPDLVDVTMVFPRERATDGDYDGQNIDELYRAAPSDADVLVRADADVLPVANLEPAPRLRAPAIRNCRKSPRTTSAPRRPELAIAVAVVRCFSWVPR